RLALVHDFSLADCLLSPAPAQSRNVPRAGFAPRAALASHSSARARAQILDHHARKTRCPPTSDLGSTVGDIATVVGADVGIAISAAVSHRLITLRRKARLVRPCLRRIRAARVMHPTSVPQSAALHPPLPAPYTRPSLQFA